MAATIKDVANLAGVSVATVSRVINKTGRVTEKTQRQVEEAIKSLSYQANGVASALKSGKSGVIGLVVPQIQSSYFMSILEALEQVLFDADYSVLVSVTNNQTGLEEIAIQKLLSHKVDGLVVATSGLDNAFFEEINQNFCPVILIDRKKYYIKADMVAEENVDSTAELTEMVLNAGYRKLLVLYGLLHLETMKERYDSVKATIEKHGIPASAVVFLDGKNSTGYTREVLKECLSHVEETEPMAILSLNPRMTEGAMLAVRDLGKEIPKDYSLASFGEISSELIEPSVTCIPQNGRDIGLTAAKLLVDKLLNHRPKDHYQTIIFKNKIIPGNSLRKI